MIRRIATLTVCILWPCIASAQDQAQNQAITVYFEALTGGQFVRLNTSIREALSQPPLQLAARPGPHVLIVSVPDRIEVERKQVSGTFYSFTVAFFRDGDSLGQSAQYCNAAKLSDCTDQLILDVKTAVAPR